MAHLAFDYQPDHDFIAAQIDEELAAIRAAAEENPDPDERCAICNNPRSWGTGNCVSDAGRPHVYPAEYAAIKRLYGGHSVDDPWRDQGTA